MWRSESKGRLNEKFFKLLRKVYTLDSAANFDFTTRLFNSWDRQEHIGSNDSDSIEDKVFLIEPGAETSESKPENEPHSGPSRIMMRIPRSSALFHAGVVIASDSDLAADQTIEATQSIDAHQTIEAHHLSGEVQGKETTKAQLGPRHL